MAAGDTYSTLFNPLSWKGFKFDGVDDVIIVNKPFFVNLNKGLTFSFEFFANSLGGGFYGRLLDNCPTLDNANDSSSLRLWIEGTSPSTLRGTLCSSANFNTIPINLKKWYRVVYSFGYPNNFQRVYLLDEDGNLTYYSNIPSYTLNFGNFDMFYIGNTRSLLRAFDGIISNVKIWNSSFSQDILYKIIMGELVQTEYLIHYLPLTELPIKDYGIYGTDSITNSTSGLTTEIKNVRKVISDIGMNTQFVDNPVILNDKVLITGVKTS